VQAVIDLKKSTESSEVCFDMCRLGSACRMATTIMYSADLTRLDALAGLRCGCHGHHAREVTAHPSAFAALVAATAVDWIHRAQRGSRWAVGLALNPCEGVLALSDDGPKRPPELKWYISEYMNDDAVLKHVAIIVGTFVVTLADDFADWFYQLKLMAGCFWMVGYVLWYLAAIASRSAPIGSSRSSSHASHTAARRRSSAPIGNGFPKAVWRSTRRSKVPGGGARPLMPRLPTDMVEAAPTSGASGASASPSRM